ncbi:hypothetical protein D9M71_797980 [compost metagenome]
MQPIIGLLAALITGIQHHHDGKLIGDVLNNCVLRFAGLSDVRRSNDVGRRHGEL